MTTTHTAPAFIPADTYTGRWAVRKGARRVDTYTARELAALNVTVIWESFGHLNGVENFGRTRVIADAEGNLHGYNSGGAKVIIHPADRALRILTR